MLPRARGKHRLFLLEQSQCSVRMFIGAESLLRCFRDTVVHLSPSKRALSKYPQALHQYRYLSSARPLPDEEDDVHKWNDEERITGHPSRRASYITTTQQNQSLLNRYKSPTMSSTWMIQEKESIDINETLTFAPNIRGYNIPSEAANAPLFNAKEAVAIALPSAAPEKVVSPASLRYTGDAVIPITSVLHIVKPQEDTPRGVWPVFRLLVRFPPHHLLHECGNELISKPCPCPFFQ
jgi:hypothetical protein